MAMYPRTVTTTTDRLVSYNPRRKSLVIVNIGTATIFVSNDPANVATFGFPLGVGGSIGLTKQEGDEPELEMYAVAVSGSEDVRIMEGIGDE